MSSLRDGCSCRGGEALLLLQSGSLLVLLVLGLHLLKLNQLLEGDLLLKLGLRLICAVFHIFAVVIVVVITLTNRWAAFFARLQSLLSRDLHLNIL